MNRTKSVLDFVRQALHIIEAYRSILRGDAVVEERQNHLFPEMKNTFAVYGSATVGWNPDLLWEEGEEHIVP